MFDGFVGRCLSCIEFRLWEISRLWWMSFSDERRDAIAPLTLYKELLMLLAMLAYLIWILLILGVLGVALHISRLDRPRPVRVPARRDE